MEHPLLLVLSLSLILILYLFLRFVPAKRSGRSIGSMILRIVTVAAFILALSGVRIPTSVQRNHIVFLVDISESIPIPERGTVIDTINETLMDLDPQDTAGLVLFGREANVEYLPVEGLDHVEIGTILDTTSTNIEQALYTAVSIMPPEGDRRIILFSDGNQNRGDVLNAAGIAQASGIKVIAVPVVPVEVGGECYIKDILSGFEYKAGQKHELSVVINSTVEQTAELTFFLDDNYIAEERVGLGEGETVIAYTARIDTKGPHIYEVFIEPEIDTIAENNRFKKVTHISGESSVLYVYGESGESKNVTSALAVQDYDVTVTSSTNLPESFSRLVQYDAVIFDNVPAYDLSYSRMEEIESYVKNTGGGFIMFGGDSSFGVGGYYRTPIERLLPVDMDASSTVDIPSLVLLLIIDKSGSMSATIDSGETKLDLVKQAVLTSVDLLNPLHIVGVLAFDADYEWAVSPGQAGNKGYIADRIEMITTGGGTILYPVLEAGFEGLLKTEAAIKHIILLSDGLVEEADYETLTKRMAAEKITLSTVAVGNDANKELLENMAEWSGGRFYYTADVRNVPNIFASETMIASRGIVDEEPFLPEIVGYDEIISGLEEGIPGLEGHIITYGKPGSRLILATPDGNPLLSSYRYGLGRSAAFTSDLHGYWSRAWISWDKLPQFLAQLVRWVERPVREDFLNVELTYSSGKGSLTINAIDGGGSFINKLELESVVVDPSGREMSAVIEQKAPGLYTYTFDADLPGEYFVTMYSEDPTSAVVPRTYALSIPFSEEYLPLPVNYPLLSEIAGRTGGDILSEAEVTMDRILQGSSGLFVTYDELWFIIIVSGLLIFLVELFIRRPLVPKGFLRALTARLKERKTKQYTYEELTEYMRAKQAEIETTRYTHYYSSEMKDTDLAARLYLAKKRSRRG